MRKLTQNPIKVQLYCGVLKCFVLKHFTQRYHRMGVRSLPRLVLNITIGIRRFDVI